MTCCLGMCAISCVCSGQVVITLIMQIAGYVSAKLALNMMSYLLITWYQHICTHWDILQAMWILVACQKWRSRSSVVCIPLFPLSRGIWCNVVMVVQMGQYFLVVCCCTCVWHGGNPSGAFCSQSVVLQYESAVVLFFLFSFWIGLGDLLASRSPFITLLVLHTRNGLPANIQYTHYTESCTEQPPLSDYVHTLNWVNLAWF